MNSNFSNLLDLRNLQEQVQNFVKIHFLWVQSIVLVYNFVFLPIFLQIMISASSIEQLLADLSSACLLTPVRMLKIRVDPNESCFS